ncbi:MAG: YajQ family cyclic di-GMP-binding protein [Holophagaceae bacterium]|jgi:uncharacterized protein YajQ (UPF0234 family)
MATECSFDVVSKVDFQEVKNAIEHALKEIRQRYDFKGSVSSIELIASDKIALSSDDEIKLKAVIDVLQSKLFKRGVSIRALTYGKIQQASKGSVRQEITISQGIPQEKAKLFINGIKENKFKVQVSIQGDQLRISGKDKDTLQEVIAFLRREQGRANIDIQIVNLRG